ncbi:AAA family ATPase [Sediminibacillus halophilus]|nr:AAA family ATPase [Sediminibacillus halophilus]
MDSYSNEAIEILSLLKRRKNVLLSGPPGCGKSRLLNEVGHAFMDTPVTSVSAPSPVLVPDSPVAIPREVETEHEEFQNVWPAEGRDQRKVFKTVFHQQTKHREFVSGLSPLTNGESGFRVVSGTLYRASEHAKLQGGASLLVIDEINRGPAVQVFGGSIAGIEPEKRLNEDNTDTLNTQYFELLDPETGDIIEYALPQHLYILAAMNQADTSVEPLDVAFLRRWAPYRLKPDYGVLREYFSLEENDDDLPSTPENALSVYEAAIRALNAINKRIRLGKGKEFQLGHGVFLTNEKEPSLELDEALEDVTELWGYVQEHIEEVFFGDIYGMATVLNVTSGIRSHPLKLQEITFGGEPRLDLQGLDEVDNHNIYKLLKAVSEG